MKKMAKRTYKVNAYGNVNGYSGGRKVEEFGGRSWSEAWAQKWCTGLNREDAETAALNERNPVHGVGHMQGRGAA